MRRLNRRAQSTGEYAVLFAIVLGAVIAVQSYVRNRISTGLEFAANSYLTTVANGATVANINRSSSSTSTARSTMTTAGTGNLTSGSDSRQVVVNP